MTRDVVAAAEYEDRRRGADRLRGLGQCCERVEGLDEGFKRCLPAGGRGCCSLLRFRDTAPLTSDRSRQATRPSVLARSVGDGASAARIWLHPPDSHLAGAAARRREPLEGDPVDGLP